MKEELRKLLEELTRKFIEYEVNPQLVYPRLQAAEYITPDEAELIKEEVTSTKKLNAIFTYLKPKPEGLLKDLQKICFENKHIDIFNEIQLKLRQGSNDSLIWNPPTQPIPNLADHKEEVERLQKELHEYYDDDLNYFEKCWTCIGVKGLELDTYFNVGIEIEQQRISKTLTFVDLKKCLKSGYKSIVLVGEQGIGKSTVVHEITREWHKDICENYMRELFDFVILIRLIEVSRIQHFIDLVRIPFNQNSALKFLSFLQKDDYQKRMLFIFDGYDEYKEERSNAILKKFFAKEIWSNVTTIVTMKKNFVTDHYTFGKRCLTLKLKGFNEDGIEAHMQKFQLNDEARIQFVFRHKEIFKVPLFLTIHCFIEKELYGPNTIIEKDYEIFILFNEYTKILLERYSKKKKTFDSGEQERFLYDFGRIIDKENGRITEIERVMQIAQDIGFLNPTSGIIISSSTKNSDYAKPKFHFPHDMFRIYFKAYYFKLLLEKGEENYFELNSRTYLSYFLTGLSKSYRNDVFRKSWDINVEVFRLPHLVYHKDLPTLEVSCKHNRIVFHTIPQQDDDPLYLPDMAINKIIPETVANKLMISENITTIKKLECQTDRNLAYLHIDGACLTEKTFLLYYNKVDFINCTVDNSFWKNLSTSEIESLRFINCSFVSFGNWDINEQKFRTPLKYILCRNIKNICYLRFLSQLPNLTTIHIENCTQLNKIISEILRCQKIEVFTADLTDFVDDIFLLKSLSNYKFLTKLTFFNYISTFPNGALKRIIEIGGFDLLKEIHLSNDVKQYFGQENVNTNFCYSNNKEETQVQTFSKITTINLMNTCVAEIYSMLECYKCFENLENFLVESFISNCIHKGDDISWQKIQFKFSRLQYFTRLKHLKLSNVCVSTNTLFVISEACKELTNLQIFDISLNNFLRDNNWQSFFVNLSQINGLRYLNLTQCKIAQTCLDALVSAINSNQFARLEILNIQSQKCENAICNININDFARSIQNLTDLKELKLMKFFHEFPSCIKASFEVITNLEVLDISQLNMEHAQDDFFDVFINFKKLRSLSINLNGLKTSHITSMMQILVFGNENFPSMDTFEMHGSNACTEYLFEQLQKIPGLKHLRICNATMCSNKLESLACSLENKIRLESFVLEKSKISGNLDHLLDVLSHMTSLTIFSLPIELRDHIDVCEHLVRKYSRLYCLHPTASELFINTEFNILSFDQ